jgi:hypothetical protein
LNRLIELLEKSSPLLIHGCFTKAVPMGCLATHIAWHHPQTQHRTLDAGITWLHHVAGLNPATSHVLREWDRRGVLDLELRADLLAFFKQAQLAGGAWSVESGEKRQCPSRFSPYSALPSPLVEEC